MDRSFNMESLPDGWGDSVAMQSFIRLKKNALGVPSSNNTHTGRNSPTNRSKYVISCFWYEILVTKP